jgi:hypothetical protein
MANARQSKIVDRVLATCDLCTRQFATFQFATFQELPTSTATSRIDVEKCVVDDVIPDVGVSNFFVSTKKRVELRLAGLVRVTGSYSRTTCWRKGR